MKQLITTLILISLVSACRGPQAPVVESTSTQVPPTATRTMFPAAATETVLPAVTAITETPEIPTPTASTLRTSPTDGMPQVFIPSGTFRMGGMDARSGADERPAHYVALDSFWMDQLEVTNALYLLCLQTGPCTAPQSIKSSRRSEYFKNPEFNDYPVVYVTWGQAKA